MTASGTVTWDLADYQGSVRLVINNSDNVLATTTYSAFGVVTGGTIYSEYAFQGMQFDSMMGVDLTAGRPYNPTIGRFLSQDPKQFGPGYANLYEFAGNGPTDGSETQRRLVVRANKRDRVVEEQILEHNQISRHGSRDEPNYVCDAWGRSADPAISTRGGSCSGTRERGVENLRQDFK